MDDAVLAQLMLPPGLPGSGRLRYAAAMQLNRAGRLSPEALEVFRICSPRDGEDPMILLGQRGLARELPAPSASSPEQSLHALLDEVDVYLSGLAGPGTGELRAGLAMARGKPISLPKPQKSAVVDAHLQQALVQLRATHPSLALAIAAAAPLLKWVTYDAYPAELIGESFRTGHAFASLVGEEAPFRAEDFDIGLFLIAPHVLYRDHNHAAPELYAPLTGPHGWRFGPDASLVIKPAHEPVWNDPFAPHLTKVGPVPFLCLFGWTRDVMQPATVLPATDWPQLESLRITPTGTFE
ncbi:dimethylsulfoniopropionate lyase [Tabrizicola sp. J26]|uniref:dimethylsulfonioproprionate lyase family protein n=1 Tax=Alitabrizicola rongguiensis TaxID=2909234 RepID=UPI001F19559B|nr:dimethylsulfonioproprionate lyase family protein [Tabrizicola rongguiensis]MCF1708131.1 dimethylsulfoniopropionate lyase [Tabrizicola rongguiensis]